MQKKTRPTAKTGGAMNCRRNWSGARPESRRSGKPKRTLEARAREKAAAEGADPKQAQPKEKDQYNFTDPESRIMKGADGFVQAYNARAAGEPDWQLIVGQTVTQAANDKESRIH